MGRRATWFYFCVFPNGGGLSMFYFTSMNNAHGGWEK